MAKKFAYVIKSAPQLCIWDTLEEAESGRDAIVDSPVSDIFEFEEPTTPCDAYQFATDVLRQYLSIGY